MSQLSEKKLSEQIEQAKQGCADAWTELVEHYDGRLEGLLRVKCELTYHINEDVRAEIWIKVLRGISRYEHVDRKTFLAWLFQIARHAVIDHVRKKNRKPPSTESVELDSIPKKCDSESLIADMVRSEDVNEIRRRLASLTDRERSVSDCRYLRAIRGLENMTQQQTADDLGLTLDEVRGAEAKAKKKLAADDRGKSSGGYSKGA